MTYAVLSVDGACSGRRATCAAVLSVNEDVVAEASRHLPDVDGYVLAAEVAGVALARELLRREDGALELTIETDNPNVPRVIEGLYRPKQFSRIPPSLLDDARAVCREQKAEFKVCPRNSTPGLRRADKLAGDHLWRRGS